MPTCFPCQPKLIHSETERVVKNYSVDNSICFPVLYQNKCVQLDVSVAVLVIMIGFFSLVHV